MPPASQQGKTHEEVVAELAVEDVCDVGIVTVEDAVKLLMTDGPSAVVPPDPIGADVATLMRLVDSPGALVVGMVESGGRENLLGGPTTGTEAVLRLSVVESELEADGNVEVIGTVVVSLTRLEELGVGIVRLCFTR
jgi:hypothetical protein